MNRRKLQEIEHPLDYSLWVTLLLMGTVGAIALPDYVKLGASKLTNTVGSAVSGALETVKAAPNKVETVALKARSRLPNWVPGSTADLYGSYTLPSKLEPEFIKELEAIARRMKTRPEWVLALMGFETGGTYEPCKKNFVDATGLIQFIPSTARGLGTSTAQLCNMSRIEQLKWVEKYFRPFKGKMNSLENTYAAVLTGRTGWGRGAVWRSPTIQYRQNNGLDINRDGAITMQEASAKVRQYLPSVSSYRALRGS